MTVVYGSQEWFELLRTSLETLARAEGSDGDRFTMCEVVLDAPADMVCVIEPGVAAWCIEIRGAMARLVAGDRPDADCRLVFRHEGLAGFAGAVLTGDGDPAPPLESMTGDPGGAPAYLFELHNVVAPHLA